MNGRVLLAAGIALSSACATPGASAWREPETSSSHEADPRPSAPVASRPVTVEAPAADELLALTGACRELTARRYATDRRRPATVAVCALDGAVFWRADLDIDCDGRPSEVCNRRRDRTFLPRTAATDSAGRYLDAAALPYVVVPGPSTRFDYRQAGLALGSVVAVVHAGRIAYGVIGDTGPADVIGEASYAMARALGIDPDPATGGTSGPVTYIAFTGPSAVVSRREDHEEAARLGQARALQLLGR